MRPQRRYSKTIKFKSLLTPKTTFSKTKLPSMYSLECTALSYFHVKYHKLFLSRNIGKELEKYNSE